MKNIKVFVIVAIVALIVTLGGVIVTPLIISKLNGEEEISSAGMKKIFFRSQNKIGNDVWEYVPSEDEEEGYYNVNSVMTSCDSASKGGISVDASVSSSSKYRSSEGYLGYSVGGANNVKNFRENIKNGYLPLSTDITYNGLYSEYYFDTGDVDRSSNELFYPSYSMAVSTNPITGEKEYYMAVGLNSNIKESDFNRKKLNLVIVLDISGSMSSSFNSYYYDGTGERSSKNKMKIAEECVNSLIDKLNPDDRVGIVLFDDSAYVGCRIVEKGETDTETLKSHILEVEPRGGTNFSAGYDMANELFAGYLFDNDYQNRIIVITDAMPNLGITSTEGLTQKIKKNSESKIYTSFIGVGVDFNTKYTEGVSDVRGFNYYSVHSADEFKKILTDEFDYMVTPLVYDLDLSFKSEGYEIVNVYGSDSVNKSTGNIMHVNTLFPSASNDDGDVKGGIIVLKLRKTRADKNFDIELNVSYTDTDEKEHKNGKKVSFKDSSEDYYDNLGIRKAIVLARYVGTMKNWAIYEKTKYEEFEANNNKCVVTDYNHDEDYVRTVLGVNERSSVALTVSPNYKETFKKLKTYMEQENQVLNDKDMNNEIEILNKLIK